MRFLAILIFAGFASTGSGSAALAFDAHSVAASCGAANCVSAVEESFAALTSADAGQARVDEFAAAVAGELLILVQANPDLNAPISEALILVANHATPGSALARDIVLLAQLIAEGHANALSLTAFNGEAQPLSATAPTSGQNGSDS